MTDLTELLSADAYCRFLANRHYENFSVVSLLLPRPVRRHLTRIYAFCRTTDDFGDETHLLGYQGKCIERLKTWKSSVNQCFDGLPPVHPVLIALSQTVGACDLTREPFLDLIDANIQDQTISSYETWSELRDYCMLSAAPVGRMVLRVFGADDNSTIGLSDDVCIGLQLANHAQDVRRDGERGRSYILQQDVQSCGVRGAVRALCDRARSLLVSGISLEQMIPMPLRAQLALYRLGGNAVLDAIEHIDYHTDVLRPTVSTWTKSRLIPLALVESLKSTQSLPARAA